MATAPSNYTNPGYSTITTNGTLTAGMPWPTYTEEVIPTTAERIMAIEVINGDPVFTLVGLENDMYLELELVPERDISPFEQLQITSLMLALDFGSPLSQEDIMRFVRKHNLERHFKITEAE